MAKGKCIFLYDYSGISAQPWLEAGYECYLFDGQHPEGVTREGNLVKVGMWFYPDKVEEHANHIRELVGDGVILVGSYPECTHLAVSGAAHFAKKRAINPAFQIEAASLALLAEKVGNLYGCAWYAENPASVLATLWRKPDFIFQPWEFGGYLPVDDAHPTYPEYIAPRDAYPKKTCIWCGNGFRKPEVMAVQPEPGYSRQHQRLGGRSLKTKNIRSATPRGWAKAVYETFKIEIPSNVSEGET
ncbi:UNVERIFIED_CONTAM: hypothetical protein RF648_18350 [Kocuria sp. CPCC 205274]